MPVLTVAFDSVARHRLQHQADDEPRTRAATVDTRDTTLRVLESANDAFLDADVRIHAGRHPQEQPPTTGKLTRPARVRIPATVTVVRVPACRRRAVRPAPRAAR
ncbi:hypothetical protein [Streptomyces prunicolor]|uniref:hypothetical protein n=1 Tax=Streptomyces prunicolor TaxID=67348 RepID=UPI00386FA1C0